MIAEPGLTGRLNGVLILFHFLFVFLLSEKHIRPFLHPEEVEDEEDEEVEEDVRRDPAPSNGPAGPA